MISTKSITVTRRLENKGRKTEVAAVFERTSQNEPLRMISLVFTGEDLRMSDTRRVSWGDMYREAEYGKGGQ